MYNTLENVHLLDIFQIPGAVSGGVERHPRHPPAYGPEYVCANCMCILVCM